MRKRHKIAIGSFGLITIIFMIVTAIVLNGIIVKQSIEKQQLQKQINDLNLELDKKTNELAIELINTKTSLHSGFSIFSEDLLSVNKELGKIKATNENDFTKIIENSLQSTFIVRTLIQQSSGFAIDNKGHIVTNLHSLSNQEGEISSIIQIINIDGKIFSAQYIGKIDELDLALLKISENTVPLLLANSNLVKSGESVITIGTPEGFSFTITDGIVSATNRIGYNNLPIYIQTNAELNQGNSGGPLINKEGKVIGMNNFKIAKTEGLGFALESNAIKTGINNIYFSLYNQTLIS